MSETKHTPEPWDNHGLVILQKHDGRKICVMSGASLAPEENAANTNLVKAAPELLAACESFVASMDAALDRIEQSGLFEGRGTEIENGPVQKARIAIGKARGMNHATP